MFMRSILLEQGESWYDLANTLDYLHTIYILLDILTIFESRGVHRICFLGGSVSVGALKSSENHSFSWSIEDWAPIAPPPCVRLCLKVYEPDQDQSQFLLLQLKRNNIVSRFPLKPCHLKEFNLWHKLRFSNPYIFATNDWKPYIFQTINSVRSI